MDLYTLKAKITEANEKYRTEEAIMTDKEYDDLVDQLYLLAPDDDFFSQVGYIAKDDTRKSKLPIEMQSMNKDKSLEGIFKWLVSKLTIFKIDPLTVKLCLSPKYDGASFAKDEQSKEGWTRGDGQYGQKSDAHIALVAPNTKSLPMFSFGEIIMKDKVFAEKYSYDVKKKEDGGYANPRNMAAGKLNDKNPSEELKDFEYVRYGLVSKNGKKYSKSQQIAGLNEHLNTVKVPFLITTFDQLTTESMLELFKEWKQEFTLDGIIIDIDDADLCEKIGRETNGNPGYARAYKANFEEVKETTTLGTTYQVSKQGFLKPVYQIDPIQLDGVTVSNATGNNAKYVKNFAIGVGTRITVIRSGQVIPKIIQVEDVKIPFQTGDKSAKEFQAEYDAAVKLRSGIHVDLPTHCPCCNTEVEWNETEVELWCPNADCKDQQLGRIIAFFEILEVDNVNEGIVTQFFEAGYDTVEKILKMSKKDMEAVDRFGERKAEITFNSIHSKMVNVSLSKIQHASGYFKSLGSKKLKLLEKFDQTPTVAEIIEINGFAEKSAKSYLAGLDRYNAFVSTLPVTVAKTQVKVASSSECAGLTFVFTGVRRKDLEDLIQEKGGVIADSVSKNTTHLIMKVKGSGSAKEVKAEKAGVTIWEVSELEAFLNN